jgi:hypothetical protein
MNARVWSGKVSASFDGVPLPLDYVRSSAKERDHAVIARSADGATELKIFFGDKFYGAERVVELGRLLPNEQLIELRVGGRGYTSYPTTTGTLRIEDLGFNPGDALSIAGDAVLTPDPFSNRDTSSRHRLHFEVMDDIAGCDSPLDTIPFTRSSPLGRPTLQELVARIDPQLALTEVARALAHSAPALAEAAACFDAAAQAQRVAFEAPTGLHLSTHPVLVRLPDAAAMAGATHLLIAAIHVLNGYDWNVRPGAFVHDGRVDLEGLVIEFNRHFLRLEDRAALRIAALEVKEAVAALDRGFRAARATARASELVLIEYANMNEETLGRFEAVARALGAGVGGYTRLPFFAPPLEFDLSGALGDHPFDAAQVDLNPFDYTRSGGVRVVENFARALLRGRTRPEVTEGFALRSTISRAQSWKEYALESRFSSPPMQVRRYCR